MYMCKCGKEFKSSQSINAHKGHCKSHLDPETYAKNLELNVNRQKIMVVSANNSRKKKASDKHNILDEYRNIWISENHTCINCGKIMTEYFGTGRFCNRSCSNGWVSKNQSDETKRLKTRNSVFTFRGKGGIGHIWTLEQRNKLSESLKRTFSNPEIRKKMSDSQKLKCISKPVSLETRKKISDSVKRSHTEGRNTGWQFRGKSQESYAEKFWRSVLDSNNINYEQEFKVTKKELGIAGYGVYFLDFLLSGNVDLEIDGKQHYEIARRLKDEERDSRLSSAGYKVYRIKFINPKNSLVVKEQIDNFLSWYSIQ